MKPRVFNPRRLDVEAFARAGARLDGELALASLPRLAGSLIAGSDLAGHARWRAAASWVTHRAGGGQAKLHLWVETTVPLQCQRCLAPLRVPLAIDRPFSFARDEAEAAQLDEESDEDMLVVSRSFDLIELLEDELILALPIVPRHEDCPQPLAAVGEQDPAAAGSAGASGAAGPENPDKPETPARENPFRVLDALRRGG